ncbi:tripartite tricarboxylate transporter TctB family protein [Pseudoclavibacter sp. RFBJ3]|uniref:tripartite tricarboxylate transporter TctB family protein n=1 Tax=unclassified Pseudoclavibacter TaxID=2615177 RepID=UPI000CE9399E|nr:MULTISPECIES: tripartite tricarboxylate transporter TctB family protein [unclassified Pseudoclavibacter]PPF80960.1 tripartite tricarboxylate transporter TctB family protein [Pseudoclavibacter sp. RFBJ5]PPF94468.1 tripartite tricarboxylate transporter TctB family protein [Pseudoclavibacter sp. RFBJ3]PPF99576.1 tripartite tricarboxylate transporter TctB family protein [Pseudoclavibacter sp. RFBH5]PPG25770.1 tripartite tricarboxylate transporter TctB family protein [Pseudoclavibacter sp. RFBI4]
MTGVIPTSAWTQHDTTSRPGWWRRRTGLVVPGILTLTGIGLTIGTITMDVPGNVSQPGPQVFPAIVTVAVFVIAVLLAIDVIRNPEPERVAEPDQAELRGERRVIEEDLDYDLDELAVAQDRELQAEHIRPRTNVRSLLGALGTTIVFIAALTPLGWLLSGAFLFWGISRALGSRRPFFDIFLALAMSSIVQIAFSIGLGLNLPPGIFVGVL